VTQDRLLRPAAVELRGLAALADDSLGPHVLDDFDAVALVVPINASGVAPRVEPKLAVFAREEIFLEITHLDQSVAWREFLRWRGRIFLVEILSLLLARDRGLGLACKGKNAFRAISAYRVLLKKRSPFCGKSTSAGFAFELRRCLETSVVVHGCCP
jgi:hypothetical protein